MGILAGLSGREVARVAERLGWEYQRTTGDHLVYVRPGRPENLSIPAKRELRPGTVRKLIRTMGISVSEFLQLAKQ